MFSCETISPHKDLFNKTLVVGLNSYLDARYELLEIYSSDLDVRLGIAPGPWMTQVS